MTHQRARLDWLEAILAERFGNAYLIGEVRPGYLRLSMPAHDGHVDIVAMPAFDGLAQAMGCTAWDAAAEGFVPALGAPWPAPGTADLPSPLISVQGRSATIGYDVLGMSAWMLSRSEEASHADLDAHGRFPAAASHAYRHGYLDRPLVDEWLDILAQVIRRVWPGVTLARHEFRNCLSHDVDRPSRYAFCPPRDVVRAMAGDLLRRHDLAAVVSAPWIRWHSHQSLHWRDPYNTFDWLMDVSEQAGTTSAFYFMTGGSSHALDGDYEIDSPPLRALLRRIHARGHEIGLHPSYECYRDHALIAAQAERLRRVCADERIELRQWGVRMHYLRWETPGTLHRLERAGLQYDSTLGYADQPGFRCGTCHEYPAFDPVRGTALSLRMRPLVAMDTTFLDPTYLALSSSEGIQDRLLRLQESCRRVGGRFTLLWHNSQLYTEALRTIYRNVVLGAKAASQVFGAGAAKPL